MHTALDAAAACGDILSYDIHNSSLDEVFCRFAAEQRLQADDSTELHGSNVGRNEDDDDSLNGDIALLQIDPTDLGVGNPRRNSSGFDSLSVHRDSSDDSAPGIDQQKKTVL